MSFRSALPDQFAQIAAAVGANIAVAQDLATIFLSERSALEREYAQKLQALVKKARAARDKRLAESIAGPDPSKGWSPDVVRRSTLHTFLNTLFTSTERIAQHHNQAADSLTTLSTELSTSSRRKEENRKRQSAYATQLIAERDEVYASRAKAKGKYDELCAEVESARQKREKAAADDRHADRAAKQFEQAEVDMSNGKNAYIIAIAKANASKTKFFRHDLPYAQDTLQRLWSANTSRVTSVIARSLTTLRQHTDSIQTQLAQVIEKASLVRFAEDASIFIEYNHRRFVEPSDWGFEPCQGFFDSPEMTAQGSPKTVLQNVLLRDRKKLVDLGSSLEAKRRELSGLEELCDAYAGNEKLGNVDDVMDNLVESRKQFSTLETSKTLLEAEVAEITRAIGDDEGEARPHRFKHQSFAVPTTCQFCGGTIWGLSKQGSVCKPCGYTAHIKCEIKVPADCKSAPSSLAGGGASRGGGAQTVSRASTSSLSSSYSSATATSTVRSSAAAFSRMTMTNAFGGPPQLGGMALRARMLYSFEATSPFEVGVREGVVVEVVEEDEDGSGWTKVKVPAGAVAAAAGEQGLVPTSYMEFLAPGEGEEEEEQAELGDLDVEGIEGSAGGGGGYGAGGTLKGGAVPPSSSSPSLPRTMSSPAPRSLADAFTQQTSLRSPPPTSSPALAPAAERVRALYDFTPSGGAEEVALRAGEVVELTARGFGYAEGWCEGVVSGGRIGIFPAAYVERL
ncbi:hypothetical protein V8E36_002426 [Tilletia maclaganii]